MNHPENRWNPRARPAGPPPEERPVPSQESEPADLGQPVGVSASVPAAEKSSDRPGALSARRQQSLGLELNAILGAGSALYGALSFSGRVRIDGQLEGSATGGELLVIGEGARVIGKLHAKRVIILGGYVEADISASESIELYIPAVVRGDLKGPQIYMDRGIQFHGTCDMTLDPPTVELRSDANEVD